MNIAVYSITETLFEGNAEELIAHTPQGEITVLNDHIPLITTLVGPHVSIRRKDEEPLDIVLAGGVLEVRPQSEAVVLVGEGISR